MAGKTFFLIDASLSSNGTLSQTSATAANMGTGWIVGTATANSWSTMLYASIRARSTFVTGTNPLTTSAAPTTGQAWRSEFKIDGTFTSATAWAMNFMFRATTTADSRTGRIQARIWKSANALATGATELTIGTAAGFLTFSTTGVLATASNVTSTFNWSPGAVLTFTNEYLFVQPEWNTVVAGGVTAAAQVWRSSDSSIVTSDFTAATVQVTGSDSLTLTEARTGLRTTRSTAADSLVLVDTRTGSRITKSTASSDTLLFVDTATAQRIAQSTGSDALTFVETRNGFRTTVSTGSDSLTLSDTATGNRFTRSTATELFALVDQQSTTLKTQIFVSDSLTLSDTQTATATGGGGPITGAINESITVTDLYSSTRIGPVIITGSICVSFINPPIVLGIAALGQLPCSIVPAIPSVDTHDGGFVKKKNKKKKAIGFDEEIDRREKLRQQITEVIHPPVLVPVEEPEAQPAPEVVESKPLEVKTATTPAVDYADLARQEIVDKIRIDAELKARQTQERIQTEIDEEEEELEMILDSIL